MINSQNVQIRTKHTHFLPQNGTMLTRTRNAPNRRKRIQEPTNPTKGPGHTIIGRGFFLFRSPPERIMVRTQFFRPRLVREKLRGSILPKTFSILRALVDRRLLFSSPVGNDSNTQRTFRDLRPKIQSMARCSLGISLPVSIIVTR